MYDYKIPMYLSDADVCLVPEAIPIEHIKRITLLHDPKLTVYRRPTIAELASCDTDDIACQLCGSKWNLGTWLCLECWEPLSFAAINDAQSFLPDQETRKRELWSRYRLTIADFEQLRQQYGTALHGLKFAPRLRAGPPPEGALPQGGPQYARPAAYAAPATQGPQGAGRGAHAPISDAKIKKLTSGAQKKGYLSHTHRYQTDAVYRAACEALRPTPTPEWLQYSSGNWARYDGWDDDQ